MYDLAFRLTDNIDPEERIEEAALWKAMYDHYGSVRILGFHGVKNPYSDIPIFGRSPKFPVKDQNPVSSYLEYWNDPAFIKYCAREVYVGSLSEAQDAVRSLQSRGKGAFLKSTRLKHFTAAIKSDEDFMARVGSMIYSFVDGPHLMIQDLVDVEFEYRFFVIDGKVVTSSPNMVSLTPLDYPLKPGTVYRTPTTKNPEINLELVGLLGDLARKAADETSYQHVCIDVGLIDGVPGVIEMNPMQLGQLGLFACNVRALAEASECLVASYVPNMSPTVVFNEPDEDFEDMAATQPRPFKL